MVCAESASGGDPATVNLTCTENTCAGLAFDNNEVGIVAEDFAACTAGQYLKTHTSSSCSLGCEASGAL